ncbi:DUF4124 domain-containing protein [Photobacterium sp. ZSDE20]|uniref:DUF4124 domain-containing protein n=1 Tax=Photobacterium pectinilyticum TaxID=2906793 RepID=A0ABT1MZL4_9GAMM|nr:DUF4124 domain-containing protein [Photobacterium sp. ZSDE20]MCQ1057920.1 DUF4124 domain-containing protein [Photobacterium sp. ZSDE20]MDD1822452.1 DUF4124 domain-containing protein [Photobacterium sp. ZSDE20]
MYRTRISRLLTAVLLISTTTAASEMYTWQDEDGVTHFSDQPFPGASVISIQAPQESTDPQPLVAETDLDTEQPNESTLPAASIQLTSPSDQQTVRDNQGNLTVMASSNRKLNQGHSTRLRLDGEIYDRPQAQLIWPLTNIDRGSHTLQVELLKHGKVIASSEEITVFLHRARINQRPAPLPVPK